MYHVFLTLTEDLVSVTLNTFDLEITGDVGLKATEATENY